MDKVKIPGHPNPVLKLGKYVVIEFVQVAYDDRYILIRKNDYGTHWANLAKISKSEEKLCRTIVKAFVLEYPEVTERKLQNFWKKVEAYNLILDSEDE